MTTDVRRGRGREGKEEEEPSVLVFPVNPNLCSLHPVSLFHHYRSIDVNLSIHR